VTGTVTVIATVCTLVGGVWPTWAATNGTLWIDDVEYSVTTRTDDTNLVVVGADITTATTFELTHDGNYTMPDDFGGIDSLITIEDMYGYPPLSIVHEGKIRALRQQDYSITGVPYLAALRPKTSSGATGQRMEMILYPRPDSAYTLSYTYFSLPNKLTTSAPYPLGGMIHAETIMESCLAIAEQNSDDAEGLHKNKFYERLLTSIDKDKIVNGVRNYGYNGDGPSGCRECDRTSQVTVNGVYYTGA
jgi:hypothetical protein